MKILHLYDDLMNLYGENGNIRVLCRHLADQGIAAELERKSIGDAVDFSEYAFIYCGSGTERNQKVALSHLRQFADSLKQAISDGVPCLFTGNALEMLGRVIHGLDGQEYAGLGLLPFEVTEHPDTRYTGDAVLSAAWLPGGDAVGFVNKCTELSGLPEGNALFTVKLGMGNHTGSQWEGLRLENCFGTYLTGPVLVKNPQLMRMMVTLIGQRGDAGFAYQEIAYPYEEDSYQVTHKALLERMEAEK